MHLYSCIDSTTVRLQNFFIFPSWNTNSPLLFLQSLETTIVLLILGGICPEVKLVGHVVVLYLIFWGPTIPFSMGTIPFSQGICPTLCSISNGQEFSMSAQLHQQLLFSVFVVVVVAPVFGNSHLYWPVLPERQNQQTISIKKDVLYVKRFIKRIRSYHCNHL